MTNTNTTQTTTLHLQRHEVDCADCDETATLSGLDLTQLEAPFLCDECALARHDEAALTDTFNSLRNWGK